MNWDRHILALVGLLVGSSCRSDLKPNTRQVDGEAQEASQPASAPTDQVGSTVETGAETNTEANTETNTAPAAVKFRLVAGTNTGEYPLEAFVSSESAAALAAFKADDLSWSGVAAAEVILGPVEDGKRKIQIFAGELAATVHLDLSDATAREGEPLDLAAAASWQAFLEITEHAPTDVVVNGAAWEASGFVVPHAHEISYDVKNVGRFPLSGLTLQTTDDAHVAVTASTCGAALAPASTCTMHAVALQTTDPDAEATLTLRWGTAVAATRVIRLKGAVMPLVWIDPTDAATVFSDDACTAAAQTDDAVGCLTNKGTASAFVFKESTASMRPLWKASEGFTGKKILKFDGTNDRLLGSADLRATTGTVHFFSMFHRQVDGAAYWHRLFSTCYWADAGNDTNAPCFAVAAPFGPSGNWTDPTLGAATTRVAVEQYYTDRYMKSLAFGVNMRWGSEFLAGEVGETVVHDVLMTKSQVEAVRAYFAHRWNPAHAFLFPAGYSDSL